jgi:hypothetical protein
MAYTARGKTVDELLDDFESGLLASEFKGSTVDYLRAAIAAKAAASQRYWARIAACAACLSVVVALTAVLVAVLR